MRSALLLILALAVPLSAAEFSVRPAPAWVEHVDAPDVAVAKQNVRWGIYDLLSDHQTRAGEWQYFRIVRKVLSPSGVQNASELSLDFDPSFERLVIHEVTIVRNGRRIDALEPDAIRVIDKEDDTESRIYDGERTALLFLKDIRAGDIIDYSWSLDGANPLLGGRYVEHLDLSSAVPARRIRHRLLFAPDRTLRWRGAEPVIVKYEDMHAYLWEVRDVPALDVEDSIPSWYEPWRMVQVTEFGSWSEVAQWAEQMFRLDERSQLEVKALAAAIFGANTSRDARITAAIRFVQDEIRYLGIEMGRNSHQPHQPWETLESRWGDCKDKTLLLVSLLRELGVEAYPALVNTRLQHRLDERLPSPFLFDHVIAQVSEAGRVYWVDGTIADQGGTLATIDTPSDARALVVRNDTTALTRVDTPSKATTLVEQTYTTKRYDEPTDLVVRTTYTGADADSARAQLAALSLEDFAHQRINNLAVDQPRIEAVSSPNIRDDRTKNEIVITEHYRIPELWEDGHWSWYPRALDAHLNRPDTLIRSMPLAFDYPLNIRQIATFNFAADVSVEKSSSVTETPTFRYEFTVDSNGRTVTLRQSLQARRDSVDAKDVAEHLTKLNGIWSQIGYRLTPPGARVEAATLSGKELGLGVFIVTMFLTIVWLVSRRKPAPAVAFFAPGEAPASALSVPDIHAHLAGTVCTCGARAYSTADLQRARYADRDLTIATRQCAACGREQSLYFV
ncbi:MAG: DUF3857 domain-containing protein, partial [Thermoanaerobaculia bacterium]